MGTGDWGVGFRSEIPPLPSTLYPLPPKLLLSHIDCFDFAEAKADQFIPVTAFNEHGYFAVGDSLGESLESVVDIVDIFDADGITWQNHEDSAVK